MHSMEDSSFEKQSNAEQEDRIKDLPAEVIYD